MPRKREATEVIDAANGTKTVTVEVGQPDGSTKPAQYTVPMNADAFQKYIGSLSGEPLAEAYAKFEYGVDRRTRQEAYEAAKSESTMFRVAGQPVELMDYPVENFVVAFNGQLGTIAMKAMLAKVSNEDAEKSHGFGPWRAAARRWAEQNKVVAKADGTLELVK